MTSGRDPFDVRWRVKGGITAVAGYAFVGIGLVAGLTALGTGDAFYSDLQASWLPDTPSTELAWILSGSAAVIAGVGAFLVIYSRSERQREEALRLDPLLYAPYRHPWRRGAPLVALVVLVIAVPGLWVLPVAHSFSARVTVGNCASLTGASELNVSLPSDAVLVYQWYSANGARVNLVNAPNGPHIGGPSVTGTQFVNSSFGYSLVQSNGQPIALWACDNAVSGSVPSNTVVFYGTYYSSLL